MKLPEALATFVKFESDGWAQEFFEAAWTDALRYHDTLRWWQWRRKRQTRTLMHVSMLFMRQAAHLSMTRGGAQETMAVIDRLERTVG